MAEENNSSVRVISPAEEAFFDGVTVDSEGGGSASNRAQDARVNFRHIELGHSQNKWINRLALAAVALVIGAFVLFVALPAFLVLAAVAMVIWLIWRLGQDW